MSKTVLVALTAFTLSAAAAAAQDKGDAAKDKAAQMNPTPAHSTTSTSDRQAAKKLVATGAATVALGASRAPTRDWAAIDSNKDNLISPDEMRAYLEQSWAAQKK